MLKNQIFTPFGIEVNLSWVWCLSTIHSLQDGCLGEAKLVGISLEPVSHSSATISTIRITRKHIPKITSGSLL